MKTVLKCAFGGAAFGLAAELAGFLFMSEKYHWNVIVFFIFVLCGTVIGVIITSSGRIREEKELQNRDIEIFGRTLSSAQREEVINKLVSEKEEEKRIGEIEAKRLNTQFLEHLRKTKPAGYIQYPSDIWEREQQRRLRLERDRNVPDKANNPNTVLLIEATSAKIISEDATINKWLNKPKSK
jgi:hypothetical protein